MSAAHWRYVLLDNGVGAAFLNFLINGALAWGVFHREPFVPLWGQPGIIADTVATSLVLPIMTFLIVTRVTGWHIQSGRLAPLAPEGREPGLLARLPPSTLARAAGFAVFSLVISVPPALAVLIGLGVDRLAVWDFILFKAGFAVADGLLVTPVIALVALTTPRAKAA